MQNENEFALINSRIDHIISGQTIIINSQMAYFSTLQDLLCQILAKLTDADKNTLRIESDNLLQEYFKIYFEKSQTSTFDITTLNYLIELLKKNRDN